MPNKQQIDELKVILLERKENILSNINNSRANIDQLKEQEINEAMEKILKAVLDFNGVVFKKTHDLFELAELATEQNISLPDFIDKLCELTPYAVEARYSLLHDDIQNAREFLDEAKQFFVFAQNLEATKPQ